MKTISLFAVLVCLLAACEKTPLPSPSKPVPPPAPGEVLLTGMDTTNFNNREVAFGKTFLADLNHDGTNDFYIYTLRVGDALLMRDYNQFYIGTTEATDVPINANEEVPVLSKNDAINETIFQHYHWFEIAAIRVAQKVITNDRTWWEGLWKDQFNKYLPIRIHQNNKLYYGWVELSFNSSSEKLILHRAAISRQATVAVSAGN